MFVEARFFVIIVVPLLSGQPRDRVKDEDEIMEYVALGPGVIMGIFLFIGEEQ